MLGKIHSIPLRNRPFENPPALTLIDIEKFIFANKMLVVLIIYLLHSQEHLENENRNVNNVQNFEQYKTNECIGYNTNASLSWSPFLGFWNWWQVSISRSWSPFCQYCAHIALLEATDFLIVFTMKAYFSFFFVEGYKCTKNFNCVHVHAALKRCQKSNV